MERKNEVNSIIIKEGKRNNPLFNLIEKETRAGKYGTQDKYSSGIMPVQPPYPFEKLAELYELNSYHARAIQLKAALTCMCGFNLTANGTEKEEDAMYGSIMKWIENHSSYSGTAFLSSVYNFCLDREIFGNAFLEIVRNNEGEVSGFYHIPARHCRLARDGGEIKLIQEIEGEKTEFAFFGRGEGKQSEFIMLKSYHPKSVFYGVPDYIAAIASIVLDRSAVKFNIKRFDNNMVLEHIITVVGASFGAGARKDIKDFFTNNFSGLDNAGKSLLLEVDGRNRSDVSIDVHKVSSEIKEGSYLELRKEIKEEIIAAHGVPPRLVGIASPGQLGGTAEVKEQLRMFRDIVIKPRQKETEFIFNRFILRDAFPKNLKWELKFETFDISDAAEDARFYESIMNIQDAEGRRVLSADEIREELGYKMPGKK